ncbi:MAG: secretin N-terminal domain-containing protein [Candidatus Coatesbacteria bacterium]
MRAPALLIAATLALGANVALLPAAPVRAEGPEVQDFNFYNTDLHLVLKALAEVTGVTFVEDVPVSGKVTVHIGKRTGLDEVLETVLKPLGLQWKPVGNVYHVGWKAGERPSALKPGYVQRVFPLRYVSAGEAARQLRKLLRAQGVVSVDRGMNQVTVTLPPNLVSKVEDLIKGLDIESSRRLVSIQIKMLEIDRDVERETRAYLSYNKYNASMGLASTYADTLNYHRYADRDFSGWSPTNGTGNIDEARAYYPSAFTYRVGAWGITQVVARLKLELTEDAIRTVTEPDVVVLEGQKAIIKIGQKLFLPTNQYQDIGVNLTITPQIGKEGLITLDVAAILTQAALTQSNNVTSNSDLDSREVTTKITLLNGDTGRLGGLLRQEETDSIFKIPVLGDLPLIGFLFRRTNPQTIRRELVILISPSVVEDVPPHGRRSPGISGLVAWLIPGTTSVVLDWSEDVPVDNTGIFQYRVYRDIRPIVSIARLTPVADAVPRAASSWVDETPKRRGVTYYYAVIATDGAGNEQAVSNSPAITIPKR